MHRGAARPRQRFQHAGPGEGLVFRSGKLRRQIGEDGDGGGGIPQGGRRLLHQQQNAGRDAVDPIGRRQTLRQPQDRARRQPDPDRRQPRDLQEVEPGPDGILGVEGVGQTFDRLRDLGRLPLAQSALQIVGQGRRPRPLASQRRRRPGRAAAVREQAQARGGRADQGEVRRQALDGSTQSVLVARAETVHRLREQTPGGERRAPRHALQQARGPRPVAGVHGVEPRRDRGGVPPQRVAGVERLDAFPAAFDDQPVRERPLHPRHGRRLPQVVRVGRQGVRAVQVPDVPGPVRLGQRRQGEGLPPPVRRGAHGGRFPVHALRGELPGAADGGAEGRQRQSGQAVVPASRLPDQSERLPPVPAGEGFVRLLQQAAGGCGRCARRGGPLALAPVGQRRWFRSSTPWAAAGPGVGVGTGTATG